MEKRKTRIDAGTLRALRKAYPKGSKVEAVKVNGIADGERGIIVDLSTTGNLLVVWNNGERSSVEFGNESVRAVIDGSCLLGRKMSDGGCDGGLCSDCGWNAEEAARRIGKIRNGGMIKDDRGIVRLVVSKER